MNIHLQPGIEGFVCNAELPSSSTNIRLPTLHLWKQPPLRKEKTVITTEPTFPVIVQVYVGALSILGLYFIYRCAKR
jgi:hypothetical protein